MYTRRASLITAFLTLSVCASIAAGGAPMGPPVAVLGEGQWSIGGDFAHEQIDMEASGTVTDGLNDFFWTQRFEIQDLASNMAFANVGYGVCDNWNIFVRAGAADASDDVTLLPADSGALEQKDSFDGSYGLALGVGTRATFCRWGPWSFGGLMQVTWFQPGDSEFEITDPFLPDEAWSGDVELSYWQTQVSLAAAYEAEMWRAWAGPFLQFINGDMDFDGTIALAGETGDLSWSGDLKESSQIGAHAGFGVDLGEQANFWIEGQMTSDSWLIGLGIAFIPATNEL
ncbi:MAG: hypothetical protein ACM3VT_04180 [Solirubrobacterales bacterium]